MFRPVARAAVRSTSNSSFTSTTVRRTAARRWASTGADKPRSWKSGLVRWGLAGAAVYYYNTSSLFADESNDQYAHHLPPPTLPEGEETRTLESYAKRKPAPAPAPAPELALSNEQTPSVATSADSDAAPMASGGASDLEAEASQQGAFNEETGEINWDCPCLGGMAHGPCGPEFKEAFSCFVFSKEEPKGVDCIDKFKGMQDCFRAHPDVYGAELEDDEEGATSQPGQEGQEQPAPTPALARASGALETAGDLGEAAEVINDEVKSKVSLVKEDIKEDAENVKTKVEDKLQEKRDEAVNTQEKVHEVANKGVEQAPADAKSLS